MVREIIHTDEAPAAIGPYSQGVKVRGTLFYFSGAIPLTASGELVSGDVKAQAEQVCKNIAAMLAQAGLTPASIVKTTIFLSSMDHFAAVNEVYGAFVGENPPARSTVAVAGLPRNVDVEIEVTAVGE